MGSTAVTTAPLPGLVLTGGGGGALKKVVKPSDANDFRIAMVIERLTLHVRGQLKNEAEFFNLCLSLARGIDLAILSHELPSRAQALPALAKQVCKHKDVTLLHAAIMVLMISVKSACQSGWFRDQDSEELRNLAKEIADGFGSMSHLSTEPSCSPSVISTVMSRFYPRMKMGEVFVSLEVKPGFDAYLSDFQISRKLKKTSPGDKVVLFIVQIDSVETSSCLISPAKVNFLVNGKGVERRTSIFVDNGPQIPTVVTNLLRYGPNLFQAVGEFHGNYIIRIAIMSDMPNPDSNVLQDYEQHTAAVDSDSEIIEGPSRISLNCPISFRRIKTPVKGHLCKHIQCFDFDNYVDINSRRPSWRCPHCNQHVCFTDLRVDKSLVKVLKEAEANVSDIIISSDGSWNAVMDSDDAIKKPDDKISYTTDCESPQTGNLLDLTQTDDAMDFITTNEIEDSKISGNVSQNQSTNQTTPVEPCIANTDNANQSNAHVEDDLWSGIFLSTLGPDVPSNKQIAGDISNSTASPSVLSNSSSTNRQIQDPNGTNTLFSTFMPQMEQPSLANTLQLQQYQFGNSNFAAEYGRFPSLSRNVTRVPSAVQALPAQRSTSVHQQRSRSHLAAMQASDGSPRVACSTLRANTHQLLQMSSSSFHQYPGIQENHSFPNIRLSQQFIGLQATNQVPDAPRTLYEHQQMSNIRMPQTTSQLPGSNQSCIHSSANLLQPQQAPVGPTNINTSRNAPSYSMNPNVFRAPSMGDQQRNSPPLASNDAYDPNMQSWRPAGRMRGALSGQAYVDAYNRFIDQPNQQAAEMATPIPNVNYPSVGPASFMPGGSGIFLNRSSGMH